MFRTTIAATLGVLLAAPAFAQQSGYEGSAGYAAFHSGLAREACIAGAASALEQAGYVNDPVNPNESAVWAGRQGDLIIVTCIPQRQVVVVFTHSPRGTDMREIRATLSRAVGTANRTAASTPAPAPSPAAASGNGGPKG